MKASTRLKSCNLLLSIGVALLVALAPLSSALANPPEFSIVEAQFEFPIFGCEFPVQGVLTVTFKTSVHTDQNGDFKFLIERVFSQQATYTNLDTGSTLTSSKGAGIDKIFIEEDGTAIVMLSGLIDIVTLPGQGLVLQDVGRIIVDLTTGEILFSAGQFTAHGPLGEVDALCAALD